MESGRVLYRGRCGLHFGDFWGTSVQIANGYGRCQGVSEAGKTLGTISSLETMILQCAS